MHGMNRWVRGSSKALHNSSRYFSGHIMIARWPWLPPARLEWTEVTLVLSCNETALIEAYVGLVQRLPIAGRVTTGKAERIAAIESMVMMMVCGDGDGDAVSR
jgi:hypothetical protein